MPNLAARAGSSASADENSPEPLHRAPVKSGPEGRFAKRLATRLRDQLVVVGSPTDHVSWLNVLHELFLAGCPLLSNFAERHANWISAFSVGSVE